MLLPLELRLPYYEVLDEERIDFRDDEAIAYWKETRAGVDGYRVRIDRALLMELVAKAPESFTLVARNPERSVPIGGRSMVFVPTYGSLRRAVVNSAHRPATGRSFRFAANRLQVSCRHTTCWPADGAPCAVRRGARTNAQRCLRIAGSCNI